MNVAGHGVCPLATVCEGVNGEMHAVDKGGLGRNVNVFGGNALLPASIGCQSFHCELL